MNGSVGMSVRLSVSHTLFTMFGSSYHHEIFKNYYQWQKWCPCKRSDVKVTEVKTQFNRFQTVTPVWIHIWWWNDAQSLSIEEVPYCFSRSSVKLQGHTVQKICQFFTQIERFRIVTPVWIDRWISNNAQSLTLYGRGALLFFDHPSNFKVPRAEKSLIWIQFE